MAFCTHYIDETSESLPKRKGYITVVCKFPTFPRLKRRSEWAPVVGGMLLDGDCDSVIEYKDKLEDNKNYVLRLVSVNNRISYYSDKNILPNKKYGEVEDIDSATVLSGKSDIEKLLKSLKRKSGICFIIVEVADSK